MLESMKDQLLGLIVGGLIFSVLSGLLVNWIWAKRSKKIDLQEKLKKQKEDQQNLICRVVVEVDYNNISGIGDEKANFRFDAHRELLTSSFSQNTPNDIQKLIGEILGIGGKCNGGRIGPDSNPGMVKVKCSQLKEYLQKIN